MGAMKDLLINELQGNGDSVLDEINSSANDPFTTVSEGPIRPTQSMPGERPYSSIEFALNMDDGTLKNSANDMLKELNGHTKEELEASRAASDVDELTKNGILTPMNVPSPLFLHSEWFTAAECADIDTLENAIMMYVNACRYTRDLILNKPDVRSAAQRLGQRISDRLSYSFCDDIRIKTAVYKHVEVIIEGGFVKVGIRI